MTQHKNEKKKIFEDFLVSEEITCFEKKELQDEDDTVVYRSYLQNDLGMMPFFVVLDATVYSIIRVVVGKHVVAQENREGIFNFMNQVNSNYKSFKFYYEEEDDTIYLDCIYMSSNSGFEAPLLYVMLNQMVEFIEENVGMLQAVFGVDKVPDPYADVEHNH